MKCNCECCSRTENVIDNIPRPDVEKGLPNVFGNSLPSEEILESELEHLIVQLESWNLTEDNITSQYLETVFLSMLKAYEHRFCYYRCLATDDQPEFLSLFIQEIRQLPIGTLPKEKVARISCGGINMALWCKIMKQGKWKNRYNVYRRAYWGEHAKNYCRSQILTTYNCIVARFGLEIPDQEGNKPDHGSICILYDQRHLAVMNEVKPSNGKDVEFQCALDVDVYYMPTSWFSYFI